MASERAPATATRTSAVPRSVWISLLCLLAVGALARIYLLRSTTGQVGNLWVAKNVAAQVTGQHPLKAYSTLAWTYPAGLFPLLALDHYLANAGIGFRTAFAVPNVIADVALALIVFRHFARRGQPVHAVAGSALIALGWPFVFDTAFMNQVDSICCLPAVAAIVLWERDVKHRGWYSGVLLGLATACKLPFGFLAFALLPTTRGRHEATRVLGSIAAVPLLMTGPYLIADFHNVVSSINSNHGTLGTGGLTLLLQPGLQRDWVQKITYPTPLNTQLINHQQLIVLAAVLPVALFLWNRRVAVLRAAAIISVTVWVANIDQNPRYLVWVLPFLLLDGWFAAAAMIELLGFLPGLEFMVAASDRIAGFAYRPLVEALWAFLGGLLVVLCLRISAAETVAAPRDRRLGRAGVAR